MGELHSKFSASNFEADTLCPGRRVMQAGIPDRSSKYADEGTAAHVVFGWCIEEKRPAAAYIGRLIPVNGTDWPVTEEMATAVQTALDNVAQIVGYGVVFGSEQRVCYASYLGLMDDEAWGTADLLAARGTELQVHDYKHGMGVEVDADDNPQMKLYALGALVAVEDLLGPFDTVRLVIHQPRIKSAPSEWVMSVADLKLWGYGDATTSVELQLDAENGPHDERWQEVFLRPNEKSCKFCRAKATCPALRNDVTQTVFEITAASPDEFDGLDVAETPKQSDDAWLAAVMFKADLIEDYLKAVRAEVERRLLGGSDVPGFKIVKGKRGNRSWASDEAAEAYLKSIRLKVEEMYDLKLISPTSAEKLAKAKTIGPRQWKTLQEQITQSDGKLHVAHVSDPRPAVVLTPVEDDFAPVSTDSSLSDFA